jgi:uncharacterized protein (DUF1786 family)
MTSDRKANAAAQAKKRWNDLHYTQVKVSVDPDVAAAFKSACAVSNVSMASVLTGFMTEYGNAAQKHKPAPDYSTRRVRRAAMVRIMRQMEQIMAAEEEYRDNIPENLRGSVVFDKADECVSLLEEAIELLGSIY